jgi:hypothetical protein
MVCHYAAIREGNLMGKSNKTLSNPAQSVLKALERLNLERDKEIISSTKSAPRSVTAQFVERGRLPRCMSHTGPNEPARINGITLPAQAYLFRLH